MNIQKYSDAFLAKTLLPFIPKRISPNQVSWLRVASLPFIFYLLVNAHYVLGFIVFAFAALSDALDGTMARTRNQVTEKGKVLDSVADRLLILLVACFVIPKYFGWPLLIAIAVLDVLNSVMAYRAKKRIGMNPGANWAGKLKMIFQCVAFFFLFIALISGDRAWSLYALPLLEVGLVFAVLQCFLYPKITMSAHT